MLEVLDGILTERHVARGREVADAHLVAEHRQPAEREDQDEHDRQHEVRHRQGGEGHGAGDTVAALVGLVGGVHAGRDGQQQREDLGVQHQLQRHRDRPGDRRRHLLPGDRRLAEVAAHRVAEPQHVPGVQRLVQVELGRDLRHPGLRGAGTEQVERQVVAVATSVLQVEGERGHQEDGGDDDQQPTEHRDAVDHRRPHHDEHEGDEEHQQHRQAERSPHHEDGDGTKCRRRPRVTG